MPTHLIDVTAQKGLISRNINISFLFTSTWIITHVSQSLGLFFYLSISVSVSVSEQLYLAANRSRARYKPSISNNKSPIVRDRALLSY